MTEIEYRKLMIDTIRADDYEDKEPLLELLKFSTLRFEKTNVFTRNLWNHFQEYIPYRRLFVYSSCLTVMMFRQSSECFSNSLFTAAIVVVSCSVWSGRTWILRTTRLKSAERPTTQKQMAFIPTRQRQRNLKERRNIRSTLWICCGS